MARSALGRQDEMEDDDEEHLAGNGSSSHQVKVDELNTEQRVNTHRSKHSETEQRRRSKINERFQTLRDLIPQNDQKRDKASFLLEVIEYIQFLQEKLQMYEHSYQGWNPEPTKLIPWRNHRGSAENITNPSQAIQNGSGLDNNDIVSPSLPTNVQRPTESDLSTTTIQKANCHGTAAEALPLTMQPSDMFDSILSDCMPTSHWQEPAYNAQNMPSHPQPQEGLGRSNEGNCAVQDNNTLKEQEELTIESGSISISGAYSQRILHTLTQALQSSGVDLSQASVSVQVDVGKQANTGLAASMSSSKGHENQFADNPMVASTGLDYCSEDSEQTLKRIRTEAS